MSGQGCPRSIDDICKSLIGGSGHTPGAHLIVPTVTDSDYISCSLHPNRSR